MAVDLSWIAGRRLIHNPSGGLLTLLSTVLFTQRISSYLFWPDDNDANWLVYP